MPELDRTTGLTDRLCTRCGLCCDGSLFADVELTGVREATGLEILGLEIEDGDGEGHLLIQPCAGLKGTRCSIYAHRPRCCQTFECRLLTDVRGGRLSVDRAEALIAEARGRIGRVKRLLASLGRRDARLPLEDRCADALATQEVAEPGSRRRRQALEAAMADLKRLIRDRFLSGEPGAFGRTP
jgi:Fe-S-cluster containining protein